MVLIMMHSFWLLSVFISGPFRHTLYSYRTLMAMWLKLLVPIMSLLYVTRLYAMRLVPKCVAMDKLKIKYYCMNEGVLITTINCIYWYHAAFSSKFLNLCRYHFPMEAETEGALCTQFLWLDQVIKYQPIICSTYLPINENTRVLTLSLMFFGSHIDFSSLW